MEEVKLKVSLVIPVYNDWKSLNKLVKLIKQEALTKKYKIEDLIVINDFSTIKPNCRLEINTNVHFIHLNCNLGHQRAIAIGLAYLNDLTSLTSDCIVIMDADGQDLPQYIAPLAKKAVRHKKLIFANRSRRSESFSFIFLYRIYRSLFKLLTGYKLSFGNFSCLPVSMLEDVATNSNLWNHYSSSILKSKIPFEYINTCRGKRLQDDSKMNFNQLLMHGLSSIAVHIDKVIVKILFLSLSGIFILIILTAVILGIKFFSNYAIPGWTSNIALALLNIGGILSIIILLLLLLQLNQRNQLSPSLSRLYMDFIKKIKVEHNE